jgi:two-component system, OmpR family, sensor kinase
MRTRIRVPLWVSLPCLAVCAVALGAVAAGAVSLSGTRGYLTRQADSSLLACASGVTGQRLVDWPASGPVPSGACDMELLSASGQLLAPPLPGAGPGPVIPAGRSWLAAHTSRPVTVPRAGAAGSWRVLLEAVRYQPQRILYVYGPADLEYVISGRAGPGSAGLLVVMARVGGIGRLAELDGAAAGAVLLLLAVAGIAVTRAVLRPLRETAGISAVQPAMARISEQMDASRAAEAAARRSVTEMTGRLSEVGQELRTPVSIVRGFAEYRRQQSKPLPAAGDPMMRRVADEITRMETLIAQLAAAVAPPEPSATTVTAQLVYPPGRTGPMEHRPGYSRSDGTSTRSGPSPKNEACVPWETSDVEGHDRHPS